MLKSFASRILRFPDEKDTGGSSSGSPAASEQATDANKGSDPSSGQEGAEKTDVKETTLLDHVNKTLKEHEESSSESSTEDQSAEKSGSKNEQDSEEKADAEKEEGQQEEGAEEEGTAEEGEEKEGEKGPIPYERFEEKVKEANSYKQQFEQLKPKVENYDRINAFCQQHEITPQQFESAMKIQALLNTDPAKALQEIMPIVESLQGFVGDKLPEDLQKAVDNQEISIDLAKKWAKDRATKEFGQKKSERDQQMWERQQQQVAQQQLTDATVSWEKSKRTSDPDYKPKANESLPDGKWERVADKFTALLHKTNERGEYAHPVRSPSEMVALMEKAYQLVNGSSTSKKPPTRKPLSSNGSSSTTVKKDASEYATLGEFVRATVK